MDWGSYGRAEVLLDVDHKEGRLESCHIFNVIFQKTAIADL